MSHYICMICGAPGPQEDVRNIVDVYRHCHTECIRAVLDQDRTEMVAVAQNIAGDFNLATMMRNFNAFSGKEFWITGNRRWDRRGAVGVNHYEHVKYAESPLDVITELSERGYYLIGVDNVPGYENKTSELSEWTRWPNKTAFFFGEEGLGLSQEVLDRVHRILYIEMYGSVRSLNVGTASGIVFHDYRSKCDSKSESPKLSSVRTG